MRRSILVILILLALVGSVPVESAGDHKPHRQTLADCATSDGAGLSYMLVANDFGVTTVTVADWFALAHDPTVAFQVIKETAGVTGYYRTFEGAHLPTGDQWVIVGNPNKGYRVRNLSTNCEIFVRVLPFRMPVP